jgi:hypothetical protein
VGTFSVPIHGEELWMIRSNAFHPKLTNGLHGDQIFPRFQHPIGHSLYPDSAEKVALTLAHANRLHAASRLQAIDVSLPARPEAEKDKLAPQVLVPIPELPFRTVGRWCPVEATARASLSEQ